MAVLAPAAAGSTFNPVAPRQNRLLPRSDDVPVLSTRTPCDTPAVTDVEVASMFQTQPAAAELELELQFKVPLRRPLPTARVPAITSSTRKVSSSGCAKRCSSS